MERDAGVEPGRPAESDVTVTTDPVPRADLRSTRSAELFSPGYRRRTLMVRVLWFTVFFVLLGATSWMPGLCIRTAGVSASKAGLLSAASPWPPSA